MEKIKLAYREFLAMYNVEKPVERIVVEGFGGDLPFRAVVRVIRVGVKKDVSASEIRFSDDASFVMAVSDAVRVPDAKLSEGAMLKAQNALIVVLYRIHSHKRGGSEIIPHAGVYKYTERGTREKRDECTIL